MQGTNAQGQRTTKTDMSITAMALIPGGGKTAQVGVKNVGYSVYKAIAKDGRTYWGLTKNFDNRVRQHGKRFLDIVEVHTGIPTLKAARGVEQLMIDKTGLAIKVLDNKINSIRTNHPKLNEYYQEAVKYFQTK
jgi:hypothetical protein